MAKVLRQQIRERNAEELEALVAEAEEVGMFVPGSIYLDAEGDDDRVGLPEAEETYHGVPVQRMDAWLCVTPRCFSLKRCDVMTSGYLVERVPRTENRYCWRHGRELSRLLSTDERRTA